MKIERRTAPIAGLEVRSTDGPSEGEGQGVVIGHASVFDSPTVLYRTETLIVRETIKPGAFARAIREGQDVKALLNHDANNLLGRTRSGTLVLSEDAVGLRYELTLPATNLGRDVRVLINRSDLTENSFAFLARPGGRKETITQEGGVEIRDIEITDVDLYDISLVTYPAYPDAVVDEVREGAVEAESREEEGPSGLDERYFTLMGHAQEILKR